MNRAELKRLARFRAGLILESVMNGWEPDDLLEEHGREVVDELRDEIHAIAGRLTEGHR